MIISIITTKCIGDFESKKQADQILEMPRLGLFFYITFRIRQTGYTFELGLRMNAANYFKDLRRPSVRLSTVMFCGTPCRIGQTETSTNLSILILYCRSEMNLISQKQLLKPNLKSRKLKKKTSLKL